MFSILKTTAVAGLLGLAALAAAPAKANEFYLNFGGPDPHYVHSDDYRGDYGGASDAAHLNERSTRLNGSACTVPASTM